MFPSYFRSCQRSISSAFVVVLSLFLLQVPAYGYLPCYLPMSDLYVYIRTGLLWKLTAIPVLRSAPFLSGSRTVHSCHCIQCTKMGLVASSHASAPHRCHLPTRPPRLVCSSTFRLAKTSCPKLRAEEYRIARPHRLKNNTCDASP